MCYTKIRKDENKLSIIDLTSYSQSDHILGENSLKSVVKMSQCYFLCDRKSWKFSWNELFFPSLPSYFLFYNTCLQSKNWWTLQKDQILKIFKLHPIRSWSQILEFYISYQFFRTDVIHQDKKRWKQVKHHWFDIIQPIRPHLRWKFFTIGCKNVTMLFSMWQEKLKIFMEWTVFSFIAILFLILLYMFAIKNW